ncbi:MAG: hypothetical protein ACK4NA_12690 [Alphaproteobacteria bacterium]
MQTETKAKHTPTETFMVIRDQGYGRVTSRVGYETEAEAHAAMLAWQREGVKGPGIGGGDWCFVPALCTTGPGGGKYYEPVRAAIAKAEG